MDSETAFRILDLPVAADYVTIRKRFHDLMHAYHPDSVSDREQRKGGRDASMIIEAYRFLREYYTAKAMSAGERFHHGFWSLENDHACCCRKIYMEDELDGQEMIIDTGLYGKYYWDPELETFAMLLRSVSECADGMLLPFAANMPEGKEARIKAKLLHLLLQEFIDPYSALEQQAGKYYDADNQMYHIPCHMIPECMTKKQMLFAEKPAVSVENSRIFIYSGERKIGRISFKENSLYYLVTPVIIQNKTAVSFFPDESKAEGRKERRFPYVNGALCLSSRLMDRKDPTTQINEEIDRLLK